MAVGQYTPWPDVWVNLPVREACPTSPEFMFGRRQSQLDWIGYWPVATSGGVQQYRKKFMGFPEIKTIGSFTYLSRNLPARHPSYPGPGYLWCESVQGQPYIPAGKDVAGAALSREAGVRVRFATRPDRLLQDSEQVNLQVQRNMSVINVAGDVAWDAFFRLNCPDEACLTRYITPQIFHRARFQSLPSLSPFKWVQLPLAAGAGVPNPPPVSQITTVILPEKEIHIFWREIPVEWYPLEAVEFATGRTNLYQFGLGPVGADPSAPVGPYAPGTMLCLAPEVSEPYPCANGRYVIDVKYQFLVFPNQIINGNPVGGSNWLWRSDIGSPSNRGYYPFSRLGRTWIDPRTGSIWISPPGLPPEIVWNSKDGPPPPDNIWANNLAFPPADYNLLFRPRNCLPPNPDGSVRIYAAS